MTQIASEILDLAGRVVDESLRQAAGAALTPDERRGLVAIALEVDRQAAVRPGTTPRTVELASHGRVVLAGDLLLGMEGAP